MTRDHILDALKELEPTLRRVHAVSSLALFGSVARGTAGKVSDVDLLVELARPIGLLHLIGTQQFLESALHVPRVDLVLRRSIIRGIRSGPQRPLEAKQGIGAGSGVDVVAKRCCQDEALGVS